MDKNNLRQVIRDAFSNTPKGKYENASPEDVFKNAMFEILGTGTPTAMDMQSPEMHKVYALVLEEIGRDLPAAIQEAIPFAEYKNVAWGDKLVFHVKNPDILDVQVSAKGNGDARAQRIEGGVVSIDTQALKIKVTVPFMRWATGRIDLMDLRDKITRSYAQEVKKQAYKAFFETAAFNGQAEFNIDDTSGLDSENLYDLMDLVSDKNGGVNVVTVASKKFLRALVGNKTLSDVAYEEIRMNGFLRMADGNMFMAVEKIFDEDFTAVFDDATAIVVPVDDEQIIKIGDEGDTIFVEETNTNGDMNKTFLFYKHMGLDLVTGSFTGRYTYTG